MRLISETEFNNVIQSKAISIVDFYADWCSPCKNMFPILENVSSVHSNVDIYKVNIDKSQALATRLEITSIPTIIFYKNGIEIFKHVGLLSEEEFDTIINNNINSSEEEIEGV